MANKDAAKMALINIEPLVSTYMITKSKTATSGMMAKGSSSSQVPDKKLNDARNVVAKAVAEIRKMRQGLPNGKAT
jgi:hypothetical protein|tara:strand:- start:133 stop:360 length:228 start_codon:yes stop_codon:yes gene_type:complete